MSYLIDTNAWIAFFEDAPVLSDAAATLMEAEPLNCYISLASVWEAAIKVGIGKLHLPYDLDAGFARLIERNGFQLLSPTLQDVVAVRNLEPVHGDPFDRIQVAQARLRCFNIISRDPVFDRYHLRRIW